MTKIYELQSRSREVASPENKEIEIKRVQEAIHSGRSFLVLSEVFTANTNSKTISAHKYKFIANVHQFVANIFASKGKKVTIVDASDYLARMSLAIKTPGRSFFVSPGSGQTILTLKERIETLSRSIKQETEVLFKEADELLKQQITQDPITKNKFLNLSKQLEKYTQVSPGYKKQLVSIREEVLKNPSIQFEDDIKKLEEKIQENDDKIRLLQDRIETTNELGDHLKKLKDRLIPYSKEGIINKQLDQNAFKQKIKVYQDAFNYLKKNGKNINPLYVTEIKTSILSRLNEAKDLRKEVIDMRKGQNQELLKQKKQLPTPAGEAEQETLNDEIRKLELNASFFDKFQKLKIPVDPVIVERSNLFNLRPTDAYSFDNSYDTILNIFQDHRISSP